MGSARNRTFLVLALALSIAACSSPEKELRAAKEAGTVEALDAFLAKYPDGPLAEQAKDAKEQLAFDAAKASNTMLSYEEFLAAYPDGKLATSARSAIEALDLAAAEEVGTIAAYEEYFKKHPQGTLADKAGAALEKLLPAEALTGSVRVTTTDPATCSVSSTLLVLHKDGRFPVDPPPSALPGKIDCAGTRGATGTEIERIEQTDPRHTIIHLRSYSTEGWGGCSGVCTVWVPIMGREHVVTATFS